MEDSESIQNFRLIEISLKFRHTIYIRLMLRIIILFVLFLLGAQVETTKIKPAPLALSHKLKIALGNTHKSSLERHLDLTSANEGTNGEHWETLSLLRHNPISLL